jgi:hypothetical protein
MTRVVTSSKWFPPVRNGVLVRLKQRLDVFCQVKWCNLKLPDEAPEAFELKAGSPRLRQCPVWPGNMTGTPQQVLAGLGYEAIVRRRLGEMTLVASPRISVVTDPAQARVLLDPVARRYFEPFIGQERSIKQAAQEIGVKANTLLYATRRLCQLGLLQEVRQIERKGRAVRVYRSSAEVFFIAHASLDQVTVEEAIAQIDRRVETLLRANIVHARRDAYASWGFRIYRDQQGEVNINAARDANHNLDLLSADSPAAFSVWFDQLQLDFTTAKALQRDLFDLFARYRNQQGSQRYVIRFGLAPVLKDDQ